MVYEWIMNWLYAIHKKLMAAADRAENDVDKYVLYWLCQPVFHVGQVFFRLSFAIKRREIARRQRALDALMKELQV